MSKFLNRPELHEIPRILHLNRTGYAYIDQVSLSGLLYVRRITLQYLLELQLLKFNLTSLWHIPVKLTLSVELGQGWRVLVVAAGCWKVEGSENILIWGLLYYDCLGIDTDWKVLIFCWYQVIKQLSHLINLPLLLLFYARLDLLTLLLPWLLLNWFESQYRLYFILRQLLVISYYLSPWELIFLTQQRK